MVRTGKEDPTTEEERRVGDGDGVMSPGSFDGTAVDARRGVTGYGISIGASREDMRTSAGAT